jgi:hypothetical protein
MLWAGRRVRLVFRLYRRQIRTTTTTKKPTGLDARAAVVVMRAVRAVAAKGRAVVVTIHQPSIDVFEGFTRLYLMQARGPRCCVLLRVCFLDAGIVKASSRCWRARASPPSQTLAIPNHITHPATHPPSKPKTKNSAAAG